MKAATAQVFILCSVLMAAVSAFAQSWTLTSTPSKDWNSVASSADGTRLEATILAGTYCFSTDSGVTWQTNTLSFPFHAVSSADGTNLAMVVGLSVATSTNAGATWRTNAPIGQDISGMACSADGMKLVAVEPMGNGGHIFTSTDGGLTWATNALAAKNWSGVACSADGLKLIVVANGIGNSSNQLCSSTNGGITWVTNIIHTPSQSWASVASSADGTKLAAGMGGTGGAIWTSPDSGANWISNSVPSYEWNSLACSADGSKLIACSSGSKRIYTSTNFGATWISNSVPIGDWQGVASSADGNKLVAVDYGGGIYTWQATPSPQLNLTASNGSLAFSWTVPSTNFVLQQSLDLSTGNWMTLTNVPSLNLTNLREQVSLSTTNNSGFFRLVAQ